MPKKRKILISPSILSVNFGQLNKEVASVASADMLHLDLMDHHFVPNLSFGVPVIKHIKTKLLLDCHLMVENPELYLEELAEIGVYSVTIHYEATKHLHRLIHKIKELGMKASVALNPATPVDFIKDILPDLDMVLIMSVNPGFGGQRFIDLAVKKIKQLRSMDENILIQVDGGINREIAKICRNAGADVLVAGSYIFNAKDKIKAIESLRK